MIDLTEPPARTRGSAAPVGGTVGPWLPAEEEQEEEQVEEVEKEEEEEEFLRSSAEVKTIARMVKSSAGTRKSGSMMEVRARASELRREDQLDSAAHRRDVTLPVSLYKLVPCEGEEEAGPAALLRTRTVAPERAMTFVPLLTVTITTSDFTGFLMMD